MSASTPQYQNIINEIKEYLSTNTLINDQMVEYMRSMCIKLDMTGNIDMQSLSRINNAIYLGDDRADIYLKSHLVGKKLYGIYTPYTGYDFKYCVNTIFAFIGANNSYLFHAVFAYIDPKSPGFLEGFRLYMKYCYDADPCLYNYINDSLAINKEQLNAGLDYLLQDGDGDAIFHVFLDYHYYDLKDAQESKVVHRSITPEDYYQCITSFIRTVRKHPNTKKLYSEMQIKYRRYQKENGRRYRSESEEYKDDDGDELVSDLKKLKL